MLTKNIDLKNFKKPKKSKNIKKALENFYLRELLN